MHRSESAEPTVAASPQGSLIVILKDNMKSTWQFRQLKAEATQTVRKVEQIHRHLHRHSHTFPSKHSISRGTANTQETLMASSLHTSRPCCAQECIKPHPSVHTPTGCSSLNPSSSHIQADVHQCHSQVSAPTSWAHKLGLSH